MNFSERVEQRARASYEKEHGAERHPWKNLPDYSRKHWIGPARDYLILSYADANPAAMEALVDGTAGVWLLTKYKDHDVPSASGGRLDQPREQK